MFYDMPLEQLLTYKPAREEPEDFDVFWRDTLLEAKTFPLNIKMRKMDFGLDVFETFDVSFCGFGGQEIKGWFIRPDKVKGKIPCIVQYVGYSGGRSFPTWWLLYPSAGLSTFIMDTIGQGSDILHGDTPDYFSGNSPHVQGFMTDGILDPKTYYYRRVFTDAVCAVDAVKTFAEVDDSKIAVGGHSQGGGISLAVAGLRTDIQYALPDAPFLCDFRRAVGVTDTLPYFEITRFCRSHRHQVQTVFSTLSYFNCVNFASRAKASAYFSVGLMDTICPPSTVFSAYNHYNGEKQIEIYEFNDHEAGHEFQKLKQVKFLKERW